MLVTGIEITHHRYCPNSAQHLASVCLTLKDRIVTLFCQLDLPEDELRQLAMKPAPTDLVVFLVPVESRIGQCVDVVEPALDDLRSLLVGMTGAHGWAPPRHYD